MTTNYDVNIERSILNSLIFEPETLKNVKSYLSSEDFYIPNHQNIYQAILTLDEKEMPIDESFILKTLGKDFDNNALIDVMLGNPIYNLQAYIDELKEKRQRRDLIHLASGVARNVDEAQNIGSVLSDLNKSLSSIEEIGLISGYASKCIVDADEKPTEFILENWLPMPRGTVSMFSAAGGTGKTWGAIQAALRHAESCPDKKVALWLSEDPEAESKNRAIAVSKYILDTTFSKFRNVDIFTDVPEPLIIDGKIDMYEFRKLRSSLKGYDFIILDPLTSFYGGEENNNSQAVAFMRPFKKWAIEEDICILFLHHATKPGSDGQSSTRGASAFVDATRCVYMMGKVYVDTTRKVLDMDKLHMRDFHLVKDNYGVIRILKDHNVLRNITPVTSAREVEVVEEHIYGGKPMPFGGSQVNDTREVKEDVVELPSNLEGGGFL